MRLIKDHHQQPWSMKQNYIMCNFLNKVMIFSRRLCNLTDTGMSCKNILCVEPIITPPRPLFVLYQKVHSVRVFFKKTINIQEWYHNLHNAPTMCLSLKSRAPLYHLHRQKMLREQGKSQTCCSTWKEEQANLPFVLDSECSINS